MKISILNILFSFCLFSVLGWVLEVVYRSLHNRRFVNPGLLKGPYLVLYGTGSIILIESVLMTHESSFIVKALVYFIATTGLELASGLIAQYFFHIRLWDYSDQRFQYKGYICAKFSIYWILLAFAFEFFVYFPYQSFLDRLPCDAKGLFLSIVLLMMIIDFAKVLSRRFMCVKNKGKT